MGDWPASGLLGRDIFLGRQDVLVRSLSNIRMRVVVRVAHRFICGLSFRQNVIRSAALIDNHCLPGKGMDILKICGLSTKIIDILEERDGLNSKTLNQGLFVFDILHPLSIGGGFLVDQNQEMPPMLERPSGTLKTCLIQVNLSLVNVDERTTEEVRLS